MGDAGSTGACGDAEFGPAMKTIESNAWRRHFSANTLAWHVNCQN